MGHVQDRWTRPGPNGRRVRTDRYGRGRRWQAVWTDPDGRERSKACDTKDEAAALLARVRVDVTNGAYINPGAGQETFQAYAERWRAQQLHHRRATAAQAEGRLRLHVYPTLGTRPIAAIRRSDIQALMAVLAEQYAPATLKVTYAYLSAVMRSAVDDHLIAASPCTRINLPTLSRERVQPLTVEQVRALHDRLPQPWRTMAVIAASTGMRQGELLGLTVDRLSPPLHLLSGAAPTTLLIHVDRQSTGRADNGGAVFGPPKTAAADRSIRVGQSTATALTEHLRVHGVGIDGLLIHGPDGGVLVRQHANRVWRAATHDMQLRPRSGWHDLRHFHASLLIAAGLSVRAVADRLGHSNPSETLQTYSHLWADDEDRAAAVSEQVMAAL